MPGRDPDGLHHPRRRGPELILHLHRLHDDEPLPRPTRSPGLTATRTTRPGIGAVSGAGPAGPAAPAGEVRMCRVRSSTPPRPRDRRRSAYLPARRGRRRPRQHHGPVAHDESDRRPLHRPEVRGERAAIHADRVAVDAPRSRPRPPTVHEVLHASPPGRRPSRRARSAGTGRRPEAARRRDAPARSSRRARSRARVAGSQVT